MSVGQIEIGGFKVVIRRIWSTSTSDMDRSLFDMEI